MDISQISEIIETVDISEAMSGESTVQMSKRLQKLGKVLGLEYLRNTIKEIISDYSDSCFFEYSILSSILDANNKDCLISLACINDECEQKDFKRKVSSEVGNVLKSFTNIDDKNWFHNPELFIAPSKINFNISYSNDPEIDKEDYVDTQETRIFEAFDNSGFIANFSYKRKFEDVVNAVIRIRQEGNVEDSQIKGHKKLHRLYDNAFFRKNNEQANTCYISFPVLGAKSGQYPNAYKDIITTMQGQCVFFLYIQLKSDKLIDFQNNIEAIKNKLFLQVGEMIRLFSYNYIFNNGLNLVEQVRQASIKSAISAIMSRNMSHNLGSHFITNTKNYFARKAEELKCADLRGIRHVLQYTQERMDYIATIVSGDQYPLGALNVKAQFFDELTINDFADRHEKETTNFFLKYLVFSEKYSIDNGELKPEGFHDVGLQIKYKDKIFTGKKLCTTDEQALKLELSQLNLAVPGGIMARHALFNIVENIMRNSAKHSKQITQDLAITLEITQDFEKTKVKEKYKQKNNLLRLRIYDNKGNRTAIADSVKKRLSSIKTLNSQGAMDRDNKGLKEILICVLWLQNEDVSKVLSEIDNAANDDARYQIISRYFRILDDGDNFGYEFELPEFEKVHTLQDTQADGVIEICSDVVRYRNKSARITNDNGERRKITEIFPRFTTDLKIKDEKLEALFKSKRETSRAKAETYYANLFKKASKNILGDVDFDEYVIDISSDKKATEENITNRNEPQVFFNSLDVNNDKKITFINHLASTYDAASRFHIFENQKSNYVDSISGSDFTDTLTSNSFLLNLINRYKTIESALTKICIIDERLFQKCLPKEDNFTQDFKNDIEKKLGKHSSVECFQKSMHNSHGETMKQFELNFTSYKKAIEDKNIAWEIQKEAIRKIIFKKDNGISIEEKALNAKNVFIYNFDVDTDEIINISSPCGKTNPAICLDETEKTKFGNEIHFLSIHLGLLEKLLKKMNEKNSKKKTSITTVLRQIKKQFNAKFIAIHSGRGNFSVDLEEGLKDYPFISLSALEAAFDNSKFFLSQLFYNTIYYGKGNFNHKQGN